MGGGAGYHSGLGYGHGIVGDYEGDRGAFVMADGGAHGYGHGYGNGAGLIGGAGGLGVGHGLVGGGLPGPGLIGPGFGGVHGSGLSYGHGLGGGYGGHSILAAPEGFDGGHVGFSNVGLYQSHHGLGFDMMGGGHGLELSAGHAGAGFGGLDHGFIGGGGALSHAGGEGFAGYARESKYYV